MNSIPNKGASLNYQETQNWANEPQTLNPILT